MATVSAAFGPYATLVSVTPRLSAMCFASERSSSEKALFWRVDAPACCQSSISFIAPSLRSGPCDFCCARIQISSAIVSFLYGTKLVWQRSWFVERSANRFHSSRCSPSATRLIDDLLWRSTPPAPGASPAKTTGIVRRTCCRGAAPGFPGMPAGSWNTQRPRWRPTMGSDDHHLLSSAITSGLRRSWRSKRSAPNDLVSAASDIVGRVVGAPSELREAERLWARPRKARWSNEKSQQ